MATVWMVVDVKRAWLLQLFSLLVTKNVPCPVRLLANPLDFDVGMAQKIKSSSNMHMNGKWCSVWSSCFRWVAMAQNALTTRSKQTYLPGGIIVYILTVLYSQMMVAFTLFQRKCRLKTPCDELILNKFSLGIHNAVEHCLSLLWNWLDLCREERQKCTWSFWLGGPRWSSLPEKQIPGTPQNIVLLLVEGRRTFRGLIFRIWLNLSCRTTAKLYIYIVLLNKLFCSECF